MHTVTLMEAGIGMTYECPQCGRWADTRQELDDHLMAGHHQKWTGFGKQNKLSA